MKEIYPQMHAPWSYVVILMMLPESRSLLSCAKSRFLFLIVNYRQISSLQSCVVKIELINNCLFWVGFLPLVFYLQPLLIATKYSKKCLSAKAEMTDSWWGHKHHFTAWPSTSWQPVWQSVQRGTHSRLVLCSLEPSACGHLIWQLKALMLPGGT